jgi:hypothetical protein
MEETIGHNTSVYFSVPLTFEVLSIDYEFIFDANFVCVCVCVFVCVCVKKRPLQIYAYVL